MGDCSIVGCSHSDFLKKPYRQYIYNPLEEVAEEPQTAAGMAIENRLPLLRSLHASKLTPDSETKIFLNRAERQWAKRQLEAVGIDERQPLLMVGILGSVPDKTWPPEFMRVVVERLLARGIQLFSASAERSRVLLQKSKG